MERPDHNAESPHHEPETRTRDSINRMRLWTMQKSGGRDGPPLEGVLVEHEQEPLAGGAGEGWLASIGWKEEADASRETTHSLASRPTRSASVPS